MIFKLAILYSQTNVANLSYHAHEVILQGKVSSDRNTTELNSRQPHYAA